MTDQTYQYWRCRCGYEGNQMPSEPLPNHVVCESCDQPIYYKDVLLAAYNFDDSHTVTCQHCRQRRNVDPNTAYMHYHPSGKPYNCLACYDTETIIRAAYRLFGERHHPLIQHGGDDYQRFEELMRTMIRMNKDDNEQEPMP